MEYHFQIKCNEKNIKHIFLIIIFAFCFSVAVLFINKNIKVKNYNRENIEKIINKKITNLPILSNDTDNVIEFNDGYSNIINDKPRSFWNLLKSE